MSRVSCTQSAVCARVCVSVFFNMWINTLEQYESRNNCRAPSWLVFPSTFRENSLWHPRLRTFLLIFKYISLFSSSPKIMRSILTLAIFLQRNSLLAQTRQRPSPKFSVKLDQRIGRSSFHLSTDFVLCFLIVGFAKWIWMYFERLALGLRAKSADLLRGRMRNSRENFGHEEPMRTERGTFSRSLVSTVRSGRLFRFGIFHLPITHFNTSQPIFTTNICRI